MNLSPHETKLLREHFGDEVGAIVCDRGLRLKDFAPDTLADLPDASLQTLTHAITVALAMCQEDQHALMRRAVQLASEATRRLSLTPAEREPHKPTPPASGATAFYAEPIVIDRVRRLRSDGATWLDIAGALNAEGISTKSGRCWTVSSLHKWAKQRGVVA